MAWGELELPILRTIDEIEGTRGTDVETIAAQTGLHRQGVAIAVRRLWESDYLTAVDTSTNTGDDYIAVRLAERGLREVGNWPQETEVIAALIAALADAAEDVDDEEQRSLLQRAGASLGGLSREVIVGVASELTSRGIVFGL